MLKGKKENGCSTGVGGWSILRRQWERNSWQQPSCFECRSCQLELYLLFPSLNTTCCSPSNMSTQGMGPGNQCQAGDKYILENKTCGCGQETMHVLCSAATQAAQDPQGLARTEITAVSVLAKVHYLVARIKQFCLQLQDVALICREETCWWVGRDRQTRTVTRGPQQPAASQMGLMYLRTSKEAEPDILYKKAATFYCSKNTHYTRSLMIKTKYSSQKKIQDKTKTRNRQTSSCSASDSL